MAVPPWLPAAAWHEHSRQLAAWHLQEAAGKQTRQASVRWPVNTASDNFCWQDTDGGAAAGWVLQTGGMRTALWLVLCTQET